VAIATKLLELLFTNFCDTVVLVTGDTDVAPAVRSAQALFPKKNVCFAFPYRCKNKELAQLVSKLIFQRNEGALRQTSVPPILSPSGMGLR